MSLEFPPNLRKLRVRVESSRPIASLTLLIVLFGGVPVANVTQSQAATAASISSAVTGAVEAEKVRNYDEMSRIMLHCYNTQLKAAGMCNSPIIERTSAYIAD